MLGINVVDLPENVKGTMKRMMMMAVIMVRMMVIER
jgi:hypothetical protein